MQRPALDTNPYQPPGADLSPQAPDTSPFLALGAGIVAWLVVCAVDAAVGQDEGADALVTAVVFGVFALLVGWYCRGRVMVRWLLLVVGTIVAGFCVDVSPLRHWNSGGMLVAWAVSWFALSCSGALKAAVSARRDQSAREREMLGR